MFVQRLRGYIATCDMTINHTHVDFDIAYPNSVQDACHIWTQLNDLALHEFS